MQFEMTLKFCCHFMFHSPPTQISKSSIIHTTITFWRNVVWTNVNSVPLPANGGYNHLVILYLHLPCHLHYSRDYYWSGGKKKHVLLPLSIKHEYFSLGLPNSLISRSSMGTSASQYFLTLPLSPWMYFF